MEVKSLRKKVKINTSRLMIVLFFTLILVVGFYAFLNSGIFNIKNINIKGNDIIKDKDIINSLGIENNKNIFMHSTKKLEEKLLENPYIESVKISKDIPNLFTIEVKERKPVALLKNNDKYCYIDIKGKLLEIIPRIEDEEESIIVNIPYNINRNNDIEFKNEHMSKRLLYLLECVEKDNLSKKISNIEFKNNDTITIIAKEGIKVFLYNDEKISYNISRMSAILIELQNDNIKNGTIDLTYGDYALYRP